MIIYEVNLTICNDIYDDYYVWLIQHINSMLKIEGFIKANIEKELTNTSVANEHTRLIVRYTVKNIELLNQYLTQQAAIMRTEAMNKFGDQFSANRRILKELNSTL